MLSRQIVQELNSEYQQIFPQPPTTKAEQSISDRIRRSLSWLQRSVELPSADKPPRLIDLWIALNALYGVVTYSHQNSSKKESICFEEFLQRLSKLDTNKTLSQLLQNDKFTKISLSIIENKYLWNDFWRNDSASYNKNIAKEHSKAKENLYFKPPRYIDFLVSVFKRISILRNQIMHGSSSASTDRNRDALIPAIHVLETMLPVFIRILLSKNDDEEWPVVPYPRRGSPQHPE